MTQNVHSCLRLSLLLVATIFVQCSLFGQGFNIEDFSDESLKDYYLTNLDDSRLNYLAVTTFLDAYYTTHDKGKGTGFKQFERWKLRNKHFYNESGGRIIQCSAQGNLSSNDTPQLDIFVWEDMGLDSILNQAGLIEDLAYGNNNTLYLVARGGGIWKSTDLGVTWDALELVNFADGQRFILNYSCLDSYTTAAGDDVLYAGGQNVPLIKSIDSGATWQIVYDNEEHTIREIKISPLNNATIVAATSDGILKTTDGGDTWTSFANGMSLEDVAFKPTDDNVIHAAGYRTYLRTLDGGATYEDKSEVLYISSDRCKIETTPADPEVVYLLAASGGRFGELLRSEDSGDNFTLQSHSYNNGDNNQNNYFNAYGCWDSGGGIAWHAMDLAVSPTDASQVLIGSNTVAVSSDGGQTFRYMGYHHWDVHHISFAPDGKLYNGNDGGLYRIIDPNLISAPCDGDGPRNWEYISDDLQIRLIYNTQKAEGTYLVHCQDNNAALYRENSAGKLHWQALYGPPEGYGIDFDVASEDILYSSTYTGNIAVYNNPPVDPEYFWPNFEFVIPAGESSAFLHPLASDAKDTKVVYGGYRELYKWNWSNGNTNVSPEKISNFNNNATISEITTYVEGDKHHILVLKGGRMYRTKDSNASTVEWEWIADNVKKFTSSKNDRQLLAYITTSNEIHLSKDGGENFVTITECLDENIFNTIEFSFFNETDNLLLGELLGNIYYLPTLEESESWHLVNGTTENEELSFPLTNIQSIKAYEDEIIVGTYGKGVWRGHLQDVISAVDEGSEIEEYGVIKVYPNPTQGLLTVDLNTDETGLVRLELYSISGGSASSSLVRNYSSANSSTYQLNVEQLPAGMYVLSIRVEDKLYSRRVVKL